VTAARPAAPVVAVTMDAGACRRMNLLWGAIPVQVEAGDFDLVQLPAVARRLVRELDLATEGFILTVAGMGSATPAITVLRV
jgi:pyruvate kinase